MGTISSLLCMNLWHKTCTKWTNWTNPEQKKGIGISTVPQFPLCPFPFWLPLVSIMFLRFIQIVMSGAYSPLLLSSILLYKCPTICLPIPLMMSIWIVSFWLLLIKFLCTFMCKSACEHMLSFSLRKLLKGRGAGLHVGLTFEETVF